MMAPIRAFVRFPVASGLFDLKAMETTHRGTQKGNVNSDGTQGTFCLLEASPEGGPANGPAARGFAFLPLHLTIDDDFHPIH